MKTVDTRSPKLYFASPGDIVELLQEEDDQEKYQVCVFPESGKRAASHLASNELYDDERPLFVVGMSNDIARLMPHLSSRVNVLRGARLAIEVECEEDGHA